MEHLQESRVYTKCSMSIDWLNEWLENVTAESDDVLHESVESVCYCGFGVISSLCLLISLFELSSTHCPAPRVLASLAVFKKKNKEKWKRKQIMQFLHLEICIYVQLMCFILILYC